MTGRSICVANFPAPHAAHLNQNPSASCRLCKFPENPSAMRFGMMLIVLVGHAAVALFANAAEPDSVSDDRVVVSVSEEVIVPFL